MLLPALNQAKAKAEQISCVANLKQLGVFTALYIDDNDEYLPVYYDYNNPWYTTLLAAGYGAEFRWYSNYPYGNNRQTTPFHCPAHKLQPTTDGYLCAYGSPQGVMGRTYETTMPYRKLGQFYTTSETVLLFDAVIRTSYIEHGCNYASYWGDAQALRDLMRFEHNGQANFLFLDQHVESGNGLNLLNVTAFPKYP
jgi:prepilin-type processing-associated H-X9-DG protein